MLPPAFSIRPPRAEDAASVAELFNASSRLFTGISDMTAERISSWWTDPIADPEHEVVLVEEGGRLVAALQLVAHEPFTEVLAFGVVHPADCGRGLGRALAALAEERVGAIHVRAPVGRECVLRFGTLASDVRAEALLRGLRYTAVRTFWHMRVDFDGPPRAPAWPADAAVTEFDETDAAAVHAALSEAFEDHFGESFPGLPSWLHQYVDGAFFDPTLWRIVRVDGEIAAVATCVPDWPEVPSHGYVAELGVRRAYRRRGLAEALLRDLFCALHRRGKAGATLHVDSESETGANRLYERVGMVGTPRYVSYRRLGSGGR